MIDLVIGVVEWVMGIGLIILLICAFLSMFGSSDRGNRYRGAGTLPEDRE